VPHFFAHGLLVRRDRSRATAPGVASERNGFPGTASVKARFVDRQVPNPSPQIQNGSPGAEAAVFVCQGSKKRSGFPLSRMRCHGCGVARKDPHVETAHGETAHGETTHPPGCLPGCHLPPRRPPARHWVG